MDFRFNLQPIFTQPIVKVNSNLLPNTFRGDRRAALDTTTKMAEIINTMGELSAKAQGLNKPVTTAQKLRMSDQNIYLLGDPETGKAGSVIGLLKVGKKSLYVFDENGETKMVNAPCVLDFYVHESRQRSGLGREMFETMLQEEKCAPEKMAVDRPSDKLLGFLKKHYGLQRTIPQMNNFVVYEGFFDRPTANNNIESGDGGVHLTDSPNTALFGPQFTNDDKRRPKPQQKGSTSNISQISSSPVGRYAAPRPMCSMAECLRSDGVQQQVVRSTSKTSIHSKTVNQNISNVSQEQNQDQNNYPVQETPVCAQYCATHGSPVEKSSEIIRTCQPCGCGGHIVHTEIHPVPQNNLHPCQLENVVVPLNNISSEINNNIQQQQQQQQQQVEESGILSPQEIANRILLEKKLALKRSGLQGTTMDQFCPSNTSIQTSGMDTECIGGYGNEQVFQNVPPPSDNGNRVVSMSKITSAVVSNESKSGLQAGGYVNPSEPVEQAQVQIKSTETHPQVGANNVEVSPEEFQEVCPKCSTTFLSSRAMKGNNLQARASLLSQKSVHQTNDTIIHNTATPAGGEPNSEESSQLTEEHSDDIISSLNVELESLQVDVNQTGNSLEESQLDQTAANGHSHHDDDEEQLHEHEIDDEIDGDKIHLADADDEHIKKSNYNKQHTGLKNVSYNVGMAVTPTSKMEFDQEEPESFGIVKINRPIGKATSPTDNTDAESHVSSEGYTDQGYLDLKFYHNRLW